MRIDAHQHFWNYEPSEYGWIDARMDVLRRDFLPRDLSGALAEQDFEGCVAVQARQSLVETRWLLELAHEHPFVRGVVGWVDLAREDVEDELERLAVDPLLKGIRHIVQDEPDDDFLLRPDFQRGVGRLAAFGLTYDILIFPRHLPAALRFVERFPEQAFVLDHMAKPPIAEGTPASTGQWADGVRRLAEHPGVHCKVSGLVTEARWDDWTRADLRPYLDVAFEAFGEDRLLYGSDWPVCLLAAESHAATTAVVGEYAAGLAPPARAKLFGANAARFYGLADS